MPTASETERVRIFDTTLRDGEQSPGASLTSEEKLEVARQLAALRVDVMEAGFPAASPDDFAAVERIAGEVGTSDGPIIAGLARARASDIDAAWKAVSRAAKPRLHTFLATSDLHLEKKLQMTRPQVIAAVREMVGYARSLCADVEFSPEDASRSDRSFLAEVLAVAIEAGATTLNIPDTVGYAMPDEYGALIRFLREHTPGGERVIWSVHCHDDLGCATANTLAGLAAGARQAEVTVNGIGERAGNTSLEEVVMALHTRPQHYRLATGIDTRQIAKASRLVAQRTGIVVPPNKAIVGANAFAHEAGIHQDGMLKDQRTYEIMTPDVVGIPKSQLVLGKHSGRHAFRTRLLELGYTLTEGDLAKAFESFKQLADRKKTVSDDDLEALVHEEAAAPAEIYHLVDLQVSCGRPGLSTATVRLVGPEGEERIEPAVGIGPIDAAFQAIDRITSSGARLVDYNVHSVGGGIDALGEVTVRVSAARVSSRSYSGYGADSDVIVASARAYLAAVNRLLLAEAGRLPEATVLMSSDEAAGEGAHA